jgi:hypothetical protein
MKAVLRHFSTLRAICPLLTLIAGAFAQTKPASEPDPLIGEWHSFNNIIIKVEPAGPLRSASNWVWADRDDGIIASVVVPEMIGSMRK